MNVKMLNKINGMGLGWWVRMVQYINIYIYAILWFEMSGGVRLGVHVLMYARVRSHNKIKKIQ